MAVGEIVAWNCILAMMHWSFIIDLHYLKLKIKQNENTENSDNSGIDVAPGIAS